jgi:hypothetical protein
MVLLNLLAHMYLQEHIMQMRVDIHMRSCRHMCHCHTAGNCIIAAVQNKI